MAALKGQKALSPQPMRVDGTGVDIIDKYIQTVALATADTLDFRLPAGSQVAHLVFQLDDSDTGVALLFGVGYTPVDPASTLAPNLTYFAPAGQTIGQTGGRLICAFKPITFQEDVFVRITVGTGAAGVAANAEIFMIASVNQNGPK